jgi:hypothetical protein
MQSDFERTGKLQRKIDIFYRDSAARVMVNGRLRRLPQWRYACSTQWWRTCRDARQHWADIHLCGDVSNVRARFA